MRSIIIFENDLKTAAVLALEFACVVSENLIIR